MDRLKSPAAWIGFLTLASLAIVEGGALEGHPLAIRWANVAVKILAIAGAWFFGAGMLPSRATSVPEQGEALARKAITGALIFALLSSTAGAQSMPVGTASAVQPVAVEVAPVPPAAIVAPPECTPRPKPSPAFADYIGWIAGAVVQVSTLAITLYETRPER